MEAEIQENKKTRAFIRHVHFLITNDVFSLDLEQNLVLYFIEWIQHALSQPARSLPEVFLGKGVLKICCKFTREHPCQMVISIKLQSMQAI